MTNIMIAVPDDVFSALRRSPQEFSREICQAAAIHWYSQGLISQGKAAELAGLDRTEFLFALAHAGVDALQITADELKQEVEFGLKARRERLSPDLSDPGGVA